MSNYDDALGAIQKLEAERADAIQRAEQADLDYETLLEDHKALTDWVEAHMATQHPDPEPVRRYPVIFGAATTNNQQEFDTLNTAWGPIRATREYDSGKGILPVDQYAWHEFAKRNFKYVVFSVDQADDYAATARGDHDTRIRAMLDSLPTQLPGVRGVICLGNEPNAGKGIEPTVYRAALEHLIDTFGYQPADGWMWGIAFSNYNVWGGGSTAGEAWLPRRTDGPFMVETHFYGKDTYPDPEDALGRTLLPAVRKRPNWLWGIGEISAQESPKKGPWLAAVADYSAANGAAYYLPFDTGVGGSAPIATSETTRAAVQATARKYAGNNWS